MTTHEITIDQQSGTDYAARAFCVCGWADPEGWHHADRYGAALTALLAAVSRGDAHISEEAADETDDAPDTRLFQALPIPTTDQNGYAR